MSPIAKFSPNKELEVALNVAEVVFKKEDGHFDVVPTGINFGANHVVVADLIRGGENNQSTLICNEEIAKKLEKTGLIFRESGNAKFSESTQEEKVPSSIPPGIDWLGHS